MTSSTLRRFRHRRAPASSRQQISRAQRWKYRGASLLITAAILGFWELLPRTGLVSEIVLPPLHEVITALGLLLQQSTFYGHLAVTLREIMGGFLAGTIIGLVGGIGLAVWQPVKQVTYPYVVGFQAIPKIVFAPLFIAWFGYGEGSKVVMGIAIAFFPVLINTLVGLESVPTDSVKLMRSLRATSLQIFRKVSFPHALPLIFAGIKQALTYAVIGALVGEFVGASAGLGYLLDSYNYQLRIDYVFALIVVLAAIGAALYFIVEWLDNRLIYWREQ
ncbi:ABC transporter permease [Sphaerisporangium perillae]|uniref:ABC transporter permease n=1 Tax=Sphaerisporangium perillae TaxID=2935860 RepID=UPI00200DE739|nr:ABC transporter permease [Sphaerisporangium perillae]